MRSKSSGTSNTFQCLLFDPSIFKATDVRDKVFALLGLASDAHHSAFSPDYNVPPEVMFSRVSRHLLIHERSLLSLHCAGIGRPSKLREFPSWVPDWTEMLSGGTVLGHIAAMTGYNAARNSTVNVSLNRNQSVVRIDGVFVDVIKSVADECLETQPRRPEERSALLRWLNQNLELVNSLPLYPTGEVGREVFWRIITANADVDGYAASSKYANYFESFITSKIGLAADSAYALPDEAGVTGHRAFALAFGAIMPYHRFFLTKGDYVGVASWKIRSGDIVCIFLGATTPFVLRENLMSDGGLQDYTLVGECHAHGLMNK